MLKRFAVGAALSVFAFTPLLTCGGAGAASGAGTADAGPDIEAPTVELISIQPDPVDVTAGPQQVTATFRFADASGVRQNFIWFASHGASGQRTDYSSTMTRTSGDAYDGTYTATVALPQTAAPGRWVFRLGDLEDANGNSNRVGYTNYPFTVENLAADIEAPTVELISIQPDPVDVTAGPQQVTATFRFADASGVRQNFIWFASHGASGQRTDYSSTMTRTSGDAYDGTYTATVALPQTAAPGRWVFRLGDLEDANGNSNRVGYTNYPFTVENLAADIEAPTVELISIQPDPVDVTAGPQQVTATFRFADASGVRQNFIWFASHGASGQRTDYSSTMTRTSGDAYDGTYTATVALPQTAAPGRWVFRLGDLEDANGNSNRVGYTNYPFTVLGVPDAPIGVTATRGNTSAQVSWAAPAANGSPITSYIITSSPGGITQTVPADETTATISGLTNDTAYTFVVQATNAIGASPASDPSNTVTPALPDTSAPVLSGFDFTPKALDLNTGAKQVTVTAHLTDATGATAPTMLISSDSTTQSAGFGAMTLVSGTAQDGTWQRTVTIPATAAPGSWTVKLYPLDDTLGNDDGTFHNHPTKLTVTNTPPDTSAPVLSGFDFTPKALDLNTGAKQVTVTTHLTDATGATAPTMLISSDSTTQSAGFGAMTLVSGTAQDGTWQRTVTIPATAAPGSWTVKLYPLDDTLGNDDGTFHNHPTKLTVTNTPPDTSAPVLSGFDFTPKALDLNTGAKQVTVTTHLTDATGATAPTMLISSDSTTQNAGFGAMTLVSGTAQDGTWQRTVTIPATAAPGSWTVKLYPLDDTLGNDDGTFHNHPAKLTVTNTPAATAPLAPTGVSATAGSAQATVTWDMPAANGSAITSYTVTSSPSGITKTVTGADSISATITGLTNGTTYTFTVVATNGIGTSPTSNPSNSVVPSEPTSPSAPTSISATRGDQQATVTWAPAGANGSAITAYTITSSPGGITQTVTGDRTSATITGLTNGTTYTFTVVATNAIGPSTASAASNTVTPASPPAAPRVGTANSGTAGGKVTGVATWKPPTTHGGQAITAYRITAYRYRANGTIASTTVSPKLAPTKRSYGMVLPVTGKYRFACTAFNAVGASPLSGRSNMITAR